MAELSEKLEKIKDEHAAEAVADLQDLHDQQARDEAVFILGRIKQNDHLSRAIASNLDAQTVRALEHFQKEERYRPLGFPNMKEFLDESPMSPMSNRAYYDRLALVRGQGDEIYDLLTASGISIRSMKLLKPGELAIKGGRLVAGDQEVEISDSGLVVEVLNELFDEKRQLEKDLEKKQKKIDEQAETIQIGRRELEEKDRNLNALRKADPYTQAVTQCLADLAELPELIGDLSDKRKHDAGEAAMPLLWTAIRSIRKSFGTKFAFDEAAPEMSADLDRIAADAALDDEMEDEING